MACSADIVRSDSMGTSNGETEAAFTALNVGWSEIVTSVPIYGGGAAQPVPTDVLVEVRPRQK
jgi:hypothetical protein